MVRGFEVEPYDATQTISLRGSTKHVVSSLTIVPYVIGIYVVL